MAYGMTYNEMRKFAGELSSLLNVEAEEIEIAMENVTRQEVIRIAKNEVATN